MRSQTKISNYVARSRNCLIHTGENTSMLISKVFLYDVGVIFIVSREETSVYIILCKSNANVIREYSTIISEILFGVIFQRYFASPIV